jgi:hypothetical protein
MQKKNLIDMKTLFMLKKEKKRCRGVVLGQK